MPVQDSVELKIIINTRTGMGKSQAPLRRSADIWESQDKHNVLYKQGPLGRQTYINSAFQFARK